MEIMSQFTEGEVCSRFFATFPRRRVKFAAVLARWIRGGAVPVLTTNLQRAMSEGVGLADAWHHQMVRKPFQMSAGFVLGLFFFDPYS